jgi:protein-S-isoprenylcysteine O-methyltransferase Ste14
MTRATNLLFVVVFGTVLLSWFVLAAGFLLRRRPPRAACRKRSNASLAGMLLVGVAYVITWWVRRPFSSPFVPLGLPSQIVIGIATMAVAASSVWIILSGIRVLGKQFSTAAEIVEDHELVTEGPYRVVRHPIYLGVLGMLIATGIAVSCWYALVAATLIALAGTFLRIHYEEKLLHEAFGKAFEEYKRRVPALLPGVGGTSS